MRAFTLSANSWHGRLATTYSFMHKYQLEEYGTDLCTYTRAVLLGTGFASLITAGLSLVAVSFQNLLIWLYFRLWLGEMVALDEVAIFAVVVIAAAVTIGTLLLAVGGGLVSHEKITAKIEKLDAEGKTPFLILAYRGFKNKFCARLEFK